MSVTASCRSETRSKHFGVATCLAIAMRFADCSHSQRPVVAARSWICRSTIFVARRSWHSSSTLNNTARERRGDSECASRDHPFLLT
jgi:hypothetical protein